MKHPGIACLLCIPLRFALAAQPPAEQPVEKLNVQIIEGQATVHNVRQPVASDIQIQVSDQGNRPIAGATVDLLAPGKGAGGSFAKGLESATAITDVRGRATIRGFRPNKVAGKFTIAVSASYRGQTAQATITQFNVLVEKKPRKSSRGKIVAIVAVIGAAAGGGAYAATHKSVSPAAAPTPPPVPTISISPGTGVAGPPR